jgi:hypothetical protein
MKKNKATTGVLWVCLVWILPLALVISCASTPPKTFIYQAASITQEQRDYIQAKWGGGSALSKGKRWLESKGVVFSPLKKCSYADFLREFKARGLTPPQIAQKPDKEVHYTLYKLDNGWWFVAWQITEK